MANREIKKYRLSVRQEEGVGRYYTANLFAMHTF